MLCFRKLRRLSIPVAIASSLAHASFLPELVTRSSFPDDNLNDDTFTHTISADGRYVVFLSRARNVLGLPSSSGALYRKDLETGETILAGRKLDGSPCFIFGQVSVSANGRFIAYSSLDHEIVPGDMNGRLDIFVYDSLLNQTRAASRTVGGQWGDDSSDSPSISADGRYVAFTTTATNLNQRSIDDLNNRQGTYVQDIVVQDAVTGLIRVVSRDGQGKLGTDTSYNPSISGDGRFVAFHTYSRLVPSDSGSLLDVYVKSTFSEAIWLASRTPSGSSGNGNSQRATLSYDGSVVAFESDAGNFGQLGGNGSTDVFVFERTSQRVNLVSATPTGNEGNGASSRPVLSTDASVCAFVTSASNLVAGDLQVGEKVAYRNLSIGQTFIPKSPRSNWIFLDRTQLRCNGDGSKISVCTREGYSPTDWNNVLDVYVYDTEEHTMSRSSTAMYSVTPSVSTTEGWLSASGRYALYASAAQCLTSEPVSAGKRLYWEDLLTGDREVVLRDSVLEATSLGVSDVGRYVLFETPEANLVGGDADRTNDAFRFDRDTLQIQSLTVSPLRNRVWFSSYQGGSGALDATGQWCTFTELPFGRQVQAYAGTFDGAEFVCVSRSASGEPSNARVLTPKIASGGSVVAFLTTATNLDPSGTNGQQAVHVWNRGSGRVNAPLRGTNGLPLNRAVESLDLSDDGRYLAFTSSASNLPGGGLLSAYLADLDTGEIVLASRHSVTGAPKAVIPGERISSNGDGVLFQTLHSLTPEDTNGLLDVYLFRRATGACEIVSRDRSGNVRSDESVSMLPLGVSANGEKVLLMTNSASFAEFDYNFVGDLFIERRQSRP